MPAPMPPQGPPAPQAPPEGGGAGESAIQLIMGVDKALDQVKMLISQSKAASPQEKEMINQIDEMFGQLMDSLGAGGGEEEAPMGDGQGQTVPPEAGGNKGAIPSPM